MVDSNSLVMNVHFSSFISFSTNSTSISSYKNIMDIEEIFAMWDKGVYEAIKWVFINEC